MVHLRKQSPADFLEILEISNFKFLSFVIRIRYRLFRFRLINKNERIRLRLESTHGDLHEECSLKTEKQYAKFEIWKIETLLLKRLKSLKCEIDLQVV